jgi:hypothetical protein
MDVAEAFAWVRSSSGYGDRRWRAGSRASGFGSFRLPGHHAGDGDARLWSRHLLAAQLARGRRRRAFFIVVMLALYPIFNFKVQANPDLLQP